MPLVVLRPAARDDLKSIGRHTGSTWGIDQRDRYVDALGAHLRKIAAQPMLGRRRDDLGPGYRSSACGRHVVFFRVINGGIEVIRVLHGRMDVEGRLLGSRRRSSASCWS